MHGHYVITLDKICMYRTKPHDPEPLPIAMHTSISHSSLDC